MKSLRVLSDPTRLRILLLLEREELTVAELQEILGMGQSRISTHLAQLRRAGLVRDRRAAKNIYYGLAAADMKDSPADRLRELVRASAKEIPEAVHDKTTLAFALKKRTDTAREYFNQLAGKFGRKHCPGRSWQAMSHMLLTLLPPSITVADLGAGEGTLSQLLARRVKRVIAVDNSEQMVEFGSRLARQHDLGNLEYRLGDIEDPPVDAGSVDLAILSQALHHATNPQRALAAAHRILKRGGRIVILDLLSHNFEKARELYADLWLGFGEAQLHRMLEQAGFADIDVAVVSREAESPQFQTVLATAVK